MRKQRSVGFAQLAGRDVLPDERAGGWGGWFLLDFAERERLMSEHGESGSLPAR